MGHWGGKKGEVGKGEERDEDQDEDQEEKRLFRHSSGQ
jgi:hypothetical protein